MIDARGWNHRIVTFPIMAFIATFIVWSIYSEVDEVVRGEGKVIPSSQTKVIQHLEGGIVDHIYVKEGQNVKKGDPIYRLKNATSQANSKKKEISLISLSAEYKRVQAQVDFKDISQLSDLDENQRDIFKQEMQNFENELSGLRDKLSQSKLEKKQKSSRLKNLRNELKTASENLKISKKLLEKGAASKKQYLAELSKKQALMTEISDIKSSIPIIDQKISEAKNKIKSFTSETKSKWLKKLNEIETKIKQLKEDKSAQKDREARKIVTSPVNGIVQKLYFHTIGGIVKAGDRIAEITPVDDKLIIKAKIKTSDRGEVLVGQDVSIAITAYNYAKFGLLKGKLLSISPDSFSDKNGMSYYEVKVKANKYNFAKDKPILPGMVADINILTGKKTIFRYILKPLKDISKNALHEQ
jgi:HlyD family secretion protein/adhesin transport system membrane fusion protein